MSLFCHFPFRVLDLSRNMYVLLSLVHQKATSLQQIQNRTVRAVTSGNMKAITPQLIQDRLDVVCMSVFYKYMYNPPLEDLSKLVPNRAKPLRSTRQSTARQDHVE